MSIDTVRTHLLAQGWNGSILEFAESSATVELAAKQAGTEPARIAKTLAFASTTDEPGAILVVAAGDAKVNGGMFKREFRAKPSMLKFDDVERLTGHPVGGVCPFANPDEARVYLDASLRRFATVFPAAGSANSAVELTIAELEELSDALGWVDVCTGWHDEE
ncbi:prolyl-tRNA editing enzyme YbaK/EbsC (Cys-tRNA(Pro) deacylase) [Leucobacter komagatae]|uniref:Prolyl-tRNA editing enzyme YbaK/EbsC (Cys-tRNA(Pro) deacylase) n=1 Tax=Leucobacter komagatae TaxID=55969 RepID=A0A542Y1T0_9MICO|nr:YbaK/EbsC family protein [Leucobacter komagatae]TQL40470.1 prolyl-tRNA editing enzyme YbaK/EbsC (Cys-tRNA(Pro) deacylase) [Leucobacter komagatae]TQL42036.1 prolyl-tRNA editing enzyme YbaK/EbsC (Cys-tRNA(Pro) deacylase) [Leucobacter komagatae]